LITLAIGFSCTASVVLMITVAMVILLLLAHLDLSLHCFVNKVTWV